MNRKKRVQLLLRVLLSPFTEPPFAGSDLWEEKTRAFQNMKQARADGDFEQSRRAYKAVRRQLVESLERRTTPDRISELEQLVDFFYPDEELEEFLRADGVSCLDGFFLQRLHKIALEFITLRNGRISLRMWMRKSEEGLFPDLSGLFKAEMWSELSRTVTPDVLIAAYFCACGIRDPEQLSGLPDTIFLSDALLANVQQKGVAETHVHFSACMGYLSVWEAVTDLTALRITPKDAKTVLQQQQVAEFDNSQSLLVAGFLRLMLAKYLESGCENDLLEYFDPRKDAPGPPDPDNDLEWHILRHVLGQSGQANAVAHLARSILHKRPECLRRLRKVYGLTDTPSLDILARGPYQKYAHLRTAPELLLLHASLCHAQDYPQHTQFARTLLCYLRIKNQYFSNRMQTSGKSGLTFFRRYYAKAARSLGARNDTDRAQRRLLYLAAFRNLLSCQNLKKLEIKVTPNIPADQARKLPFNQPAQKYSMDKRAVAEQLHGIFQCFLEACEEQGLVRQPPTLGIVYHFIKEDMRFLTGDRCWIPKARQDTVSMIRNQQSRFVNALNELLGEVEHLSEYVVGLDAASEEIYTEPWIYAPVFRQARSRHNTLPRQPGGRDLRQNPGFTYHVGEDYHHILSGLRHIDEVLTYFSYYPGDRIGHGLAMQVDMEGWLRNNEVVAIPMMEHLENMLWLWAHCGEGSRELGGILPQVENEIMSVAQKIYYNIRGLSPYVLWKAYTRKFDPLTDDFCYSMQAMYLQQEDSNFLQKPVPETQRSFCALHHRLCPASTDPPLAHADAVWDIDKLLLTHYCPVYLRHYQKQMLVASSLAYRDVFCIMQKYVQEKVRNAGVFVETNPTSNLSIGDVPSLPEYRITALNNRGLSHQDPISVLISINSDNPLIFNTNVENEQAAVYHTLLYRGFGHEEVLEWMDKVRKAGIDSSFIRTCKPWETQKAELESILHALEAYFPPQTAEEDQQRRMRQAHPRGD